MDTKLVKPDGFMKSEGLVKPDFPHKTGVPVRSGVPVESPQKAAIPKSNPIPPEQLSGKANASRGEQSVYAGKLFTEAAASLGLPKDALSIALLVFTRFFSLSADKALIGSLRREILNLSKTSLPGTAEEKAALEARAMAAVIAADKGVFLSSGALERYARFLMQMSSMPTAFMPKPSEQKETPSSRTAVSSQDSRDKSTGATRGETLEEIPEPDELRAIAETQAREDGLLDLFNNLPGKNGQNWIVFPFNVNVRGIELKVVLRVLRNDSGPIHSKIPATEDGLLIADISGPKRQWRCFLRKNAGKLSADIRVYPEYPQSALNNLRKRAERFLGKGGLPSALLSTAKMPRPTNTKDFSGFEEIIVRNGDKIPLLAEDLWPEYLPFLDEEV